MSDRTVVFTPRETKSTTDVELLRPTEKAIIKAATALFKALDIDYAKSSPENWRVQCAPLK